MNDYRRKYKKSEKWKTTKRQYNKRYYSKTANMYPKRIYEQDEDILILKHECTDRELSKIIGRSMKSIQIRRCRLNKKLKEVGCNEK